MKVQKFNEFYNRAAGYKYSEPTESHNKYIIHFALKWRISRSTLESLLNDALVELEIFKYTLEVDLLEEDIFDIVIKLNSYSDKEAAFFMEKIVDFFPEEIEFSDIYFGSEEPVENTKRSIGYKRSNESLHSRIFGEDRNPIIRYELCWTLEDTSGDCSPSGSTTIDSDTIPFTNKNKMESIIDEVKSMDRYPKTQLYFTLKTYRGDEIISEESVDNESSNDGRGF